MTWIHTTRLALGALLASGLAGCADSSVHEITKTRRVSAPEAGLAWDASPAQRFGLRRPPTTEASSEASQAAESAGSPTRLAWDLPSGWSEVPRTQMRIANFVAGDPRVECYLTRLAGEAGGLESNVNRWRKQMSLAAMPAADIEKLPRASLFGGPATLLDVTGTFTGMGGDVAADNYRMLGLLRVEPYGSAFLKLTGPAELVQDQYESFLAVARSFRLEGGEAAAAVGAPTASHEQPTPSDGETVSAGYGYELPASWEVATPSMMRVLNFRAGENGSTECYVSILLGDGGGPLSNASRWKTQLGGSAMTQTEFDGLERVPMLGRDAILVEASGSFRGMSGEEISDATLLGTICTMPTETVFVKMIGPRDDVANERAAFLGFCASLTEN